MLCIRNHRVGAGPAGKPRLTMNETITWHDAATELPDDETTVLVQSLEGSEPVWPGFHDERGWHWIESTEQCIAVTYWAEMPVGVNNAAQTQP